MRPRDGFGGCDRHEIARLPDRDCHLEQEYCVIQERRLHQQWGDRYQDWYKGSDIRCVMRTRPRLNGTTSSGLSRSSSGLLGDTTRIRSSVNCAVFVGMGRVRPVCDRHIYHYSWYQPTHQATTFTPDAGACGSAARSGQDFQSRPVPSAAIRSMIDR
uniref:Uncharacterized protein n=1 Tax=Anopheles merus TaxID=30066 RepID=A0A182VGF5_ANOME